MTEANYRAALHRMPPQERDPAVIRQTLVWPKVMVAMGAMVATMVAIGAASILLRRLLRLLAQAALLGEHRRSHAVAEVMRDLKAQGEIPLWRGEDYPVLIRWGEAPVLKIERAATPFLGFRSFGQQVRERDVLGGFLKESQWLVDEYG